jgi:excisionase family DNA binding protein
MNPTFDQLPQAVKELFDKVENIERLLLSQSNDPQPEADQLLTIGQASEILHLTVPTIYGLVQRAEVPVCKRGKRLYFSKQELTSWIMSGRKKTVAEIESEANAYMTANSRKTGNR